MTKFRKFIPFLACSFLIAGASVAFVGGNKKALAEEAQAATDCGNVKFEFSNLSTANGVYLTAPANDLPFKGDWSLAYYPVGSKNGVFIDGVDVGSAILKKYSATEYYLALSDFGHGLTSSDIDAVLKIAGSWYCTYEAEEYTFTVSPEFTKQWSGMGWVDHYELEDYDVVSLLDAGIADVDQAAVGTEYGYDYENLYRNSFPIANNTGSYAFRFNFEALDDEMEATLDIRIGANGAWDNGHFLQLSLNNTWGPTGVLLVQEKLNTTQLHTTGDIPLNLKSSAHVIEFGMVKIQNSSNYNVFVRYDGMLVKSLSWELDATPMTTRVGMNYGGTDIRISNTSTQEKGTERLHAGTMSGTVGIYLNTDVDLYPGFTSWEEQGLPYLASNITFNGASVGNSAANSFKKPDSKTFYFGFSGAGITPHDGEILIIQGSFKFVHKVSADPAVYKTLKVSFAKSAFIWKDSAFHDYDIALLEDSAESELEAGNLLANIGKWNSDHSKQCVKNFDQNADSLVYKSDTNGNTGVYFTSSSGSDGEFRVYFPDNIYKGESKGYAMTQLTFDYMYVNNQAVGVNSRNPGLTPDGYFVDVPADVDNNFTVQALLNNNPSNMYFDMEVELVNDGRLHSVTVNLAFGSVLGFGFKVWDFKGTFFISNVHADYQAYNANLDAMYNVLKMYEYTSGGLCTNYYANAKAAYEALSADEKALFNSNAAYGSARARLAAWAAANNETFDATNGTFTQNSNVGFRNRNGSSNSIVIIAVASVISLTTVCGLVFLKKRKLHK